MILLSRLSILLLLVFTEIQRIKGEVNGRCEGRNGVCVSTQSCAKSGGTYESKFCPHDPENIKCCNKNCTVKNGEKGVCMFKSDCKGTTYTGYCPGGDNFLCCVTKSSPPPPKTSAVKKSNVSANTVINNKSPAPKAEPNVNNAPKVNNKVTTIYITAVKTEPYVSSVPKVSDNPIKDNYSVVTSTSKETNVSSTPGRSNSRGEDTNKNNESKNKPIIYIAAIGGGLFILCTVFFLMNRRNRFKKEEHKNKTLEFNVDSEGNTNTLIYKQINKSDNDNDIVVYKRHNVKSHPEDAIENTEYENEERRLINQQSLLMNSNSNSSDNNNNNNNNNNGNNNSNNNNNGSYNNSSSNSNNDYNNSNSNISNNSNININCNNNININSNSNTNRNNNNNNNNNNNSSYSNNDYNNSNSNVIINSNSNTFSHSKLHLAALEYISSSLTPQAHIDFRESEIIPYSNNTNTNTNNSFDGRSVTLTKNTVPTIISDNSNVTVTIDRNETFLPPYSPPVRQSPNEVRYSQNEVRYSPSVVNHSPLEMKYSPVEIKHSPVEIKYSPVEIKHSPIELKHSNIPFGTSKHI